MLKNLLLSWLAFSALALSQAPPPRIEQSQHMLDAALHDKNPDTRKQAVVALSLAGTGEPFPSWLEAMLDDKDVEVRVATVSSLVDLKSGRTLGALHKALRDDVPEVSFAAAKALWGLDDPEGKRALIAVLGGDSKTASGFLTREKREALRMMHTPKPMFLFALKTGAAFAPVPGLGTGISSMQGLLSDPAVSGRATAALLLSRDNDRATIVALKGALGDKDWSVRAAAVHSLALHNDPATIEDIAPLLDDKKEPVRLRAAAAYCRLESIRKTRPAPARKVAPTKKRRPA